MRSCENTVQDLLKNTLACAGISSTDTIFVELWALDHSSGGVRLVRPDCGVWLDESQLCLLQASSGSNLMQEQEEDKEGESYGKAVIWDPYCIFQTENVQREFSGASAIESMREDDTVATSTLSEND